MKEIENTKLLLQAAKQMDIYSKRYCLQTKCNSERMKAVEDEENCAWYHGAWMYCRLVGIVVSEDYLGEFYDKFFKKRLHKEEIKILICGMSDYAILAHVLRRIPTEYKGDIKIVLLDICKSPLLLCKWYLSKEYPCYLDKVEIVNADATAIPFGDREFDLITTYSFLTRMIYSEAKKVVYEWERLLKADGQILTTVHVCNNRADEGDFYRSNNADVQYAMCKVEKWIESHLVSESIANEMRDKVEKYLLNIMSVSISEDNLAKLFSRMNYFCSSFEQPGELERVHQMMLVQAEKKKNSLSKE